MRGSQAQSERPRVDERFQIIATQEQQIYRSNNIGDKREEKEGAAGKGKAGKDKVDRTTRKTFDEESASYEASAPKIQQIINYII